MLATIPPATIPPAEIHPPFVTAPAGDAETARSVQTRLVRSSYPPLRANVSCDCRNGVVTLAGDLPSYFLTQVAQTLALHAPGVEHVVNRIRVAEASAAVVIGFTEVP